MNVAWKAPNTLATLQTQFPKVVEILYVWGNVRQAYAI